MFLLGCASEGEPRSVPPADRPASLTVSSVSATPAPAFAVAVTPNAVDAYVHYLRDKLGPAADRIETVRGMGYRMRSP